MCRRKSVALQSMNEMSVLQNMDAAELCAKAKMLLNSYRHICWASLGSFQTVNEADFFLCDESVDRALDYLYSYSPEEDRRSFERTMKMLFPNAPNGAYLLQIQCWMIIFSVLAQTVYGSLQGFGKLYIPGICLAIGAFAKYIINVIFVPIYGEIVPAFSTVIYNMIAFSLAFIMLFRYIKQKPNLKELFLKPFIASILMAIVTFFTYKFLIYINLTNSISTLISIVIAVVVYLVLVIVLGILNKDEMHQLPYGNKICKLVFKSQK